MSSKAVESSEESMAYCFVSHTEGNKMLDIALDSGATEHLTNERLLLTNVKTLHPIKIEVAKSKVTLQAFKSGELAVTSLVNGKKLQITIKDILIVPGLEHNLLSVQKLERNGYRIVFENGIRSIEKDGRIAAVAELNERQLYVLKLYANEEIALMSESIEVWHKRLGHLNYESLKRLSSQVNECK